MSAEPYKIKEVKKIVSLSVHERWNLIKRAHFNTFHLSSEHVSFDLVARGMSAWSHFQKAAYMIGDEAYAGSRNFIALEKASADVLGLRRIVPAHNGIGAEKLLATTMITKGQLVLHNRGRCHGLVADNGGTSIDVTSRKVLSYEPPQSFGGDVDLDALRKHLEGKQSVAYVHLETCPPAHNGQPFSLANYEQVCALAAKHHVPVALDISNVLENAFWICKSERKDMKLLDAMRTLVDAADIVMIDASQDPRADIGGFITARDDEAFEKLRAQVVVFEGLHSYGGMTGRAMEVFATGLREMQLAEYTEWYQSQIAELHGLLAAEKVPAYLGTCGVALDVGRFLPHLKPNQQPKPVLAACLYIQSGIRGRIEGPWSFHSEGEGRRTLQLELPRHAYTRNHLREVADGIISVWRKRDEIADLSLTNTPEFYDEARFEPVHGRLFVELPRSVRSEKRIYEPYKIAIFEPLKVTDKPYRRRALEEAGYNTFLLDSENVYLDFLTDSGTSAMSCRQWEGMTDSMDTPYSNRHYQRLVELCREVLGFEHIIPTHQGRAAEHIMSQVMIKPGQLVPGNMYFTTTKLHQEMAGGVFVDVIIDEAHDPQNPHPWKGNIDLEKLSAEIKRVGEKNVAYVSFEMSVNLAGGQPFSMQNLKDVSRLCQRHGIPIMFDATRCVENAYMIKPKDPEYAHRTVHDILREIMSYGDGCTISAKKDFLVNMGGILACNSHDLAQRFNRMLRIWEGDVTNGGLDPKDIEALARGLEDSLDDQYIRMRVQQTHEFGESLIKANVPVVVPIGTHAVFLDARRFLPHIDQEEYPAQALAAAVYLETGVRTMERGNVSKGRDPRTGQNYRPKLELVRCTIPRRVYTPSHIDYVVEGIRRLWDKREAISGLTFVHEPKVLRFFQGRFKTVRPWDF